MSRHNKVNKDHYVQRGRLTPDEAARELAKMRQVGSQHTWQPTKKDALPRRESKDPADGTETTEDNDNKEVATEAEPHLAARATKGNTAVKKAVKSNMKGSKTRAAKTGTAKKTAKAKTVNSAKSTGGKQKRKAVLARNVGGGGATPRAAKRGKS